MNDYGFSTRAIHSADFTMNQPGDPVTFPIFQTVSFSFDSTAEQMDQPNNTDTQYAYSRLSNPTVAAFEQVIAQLEGAESAVGFASGMAAIHATIVGLLHAGDHILVTRDIYGGTYGLLTTLLPSLGITHSFVDMTDLAATAAAIQPNTRLLWGETLSNPTNVVLDINALATLAHQHDCLFSVDATFTSPYLSLPLAQGADLVVHSATKYISGHGDVIAGVVSGSHALIAKVRSVMTTAGGIMAPLEAFLLLRGLKTLELRMERHCSTALALAQSLQQHPIVNRVCYAGLPSHPQYTLAQQQMRAYGGVVSFSVHGDQSTAQHIVDRLKLAKRAGSLGDAHTLVSLPVMTSHRLLTPAMRETIGVTDTMIRVPVGLENPADIINDFDQAIKG